MGRFRLSALCIMMLATGCGSAKSFGPELVPVKGKVTFDGKPIKDGSVTFLQKDGKTSFSGHLTNGQYELGSKQSGLGAPAGDYVVSVVAWEEPPSIDSSKPEKEAIPRRYFDAKLSGLTATVASKGPIVLDFALKP